MKWEEFKTLVDKAIENKKYLVPHDSVDPEISYIDISYPDTDDFNIILEEFEDCIELKII